MQVNAGRCEDRVFGSWIVCWIFWMFSHENGENYFTKFAKMQVLILTSAYLIIFRF